MASAARIFVLLLTGNAVIEVIGHGMLLNPPSRVSLWRDDRYKSLAGDLDIREYTDNQYNCGGHWRQWGQNGGKCGICGDAWDGPRKSEFNGKYAKNIIVDSYRSGEVINILIKLTSNHMGWFEFRLCAHDDLQSEATQSCLDSNLLQMADGTGTRYIVKSGWGERTISVKLPADVTCSRCVLQWKYHTASNWGRDSNGISCKGCGSQEEFYACADIAISADGGSKGTTKPVLPNPERPACRGAGALEASDEVAKRCDIACAKGCCPLELCNSYC